MSCSSLKTKDHSYVLHEEKFDQNLDNWIIEQMEDGTVQIDNDALEISQGNGAVVWFKKKLEAPVTIQYEITVIYQGGSHDRIADMNCFWMANDPNSKDDFFKYSSERSGIFSAYFTHSLYYVGQGAHNNTKTRYRKYTGNGERPLEPQHDLSDPAYLITANKKNNIKIKVSNNRTQYFCNELLIYDIMDNNTYTSGYFGIRSYKNHMRMDNLVITRP